MITVGIIGGVASGKSTISRRLAELGAVVLDADRIGHEVLAEPDVIAAAIERWGDEVVDSSGHLIRAAIAKRVFAAKESPTAISEATQELRFWESQTHPRITKRVTAVLKRLAEPQSEWSSSDESTTNIEVPTKKAESPTKNVVVLDAALLLRAEWDQFCDELIFVDVPHEIRLKRGLERGWTAEHFAAREAAQLPLDQKKEKATVVIDNGGALDQTYEQVLRFWQGLSD